MALFQKSVLQKYLKTIDEKAVNEAWQKFTQYFHNSDIQKNIRNSNEIKLQTTFLKELFVKILGYTLNPQPNYNLDTEVKNVKGTKKVDGAILKDEKAIAVIELKGTNTVDLDKVEQQAFGYKNNQPDAVYVITSNFEKLRFYIDNATEHLEFNLFQLSQDQFKLLWLCLAKDNVFSDLPKTINKESLVEEENITKQLYKDYSNFKQAIYNNIVQLNPKYDKLLLFKKTQKLLDRFLFVFFAEDRGLLPPNSMPRIIDRWEKLKELDNYKPLYEIVQQYFDYFNKGRKGKKSIDDIFAYNGGLFRADKVLDKLKIDDDILLNHTLKLSAYDFESEVDVNILGHIFEHSLNEIEEMTAKLEGKTIDKSKTKRKKDGVFYTPKYITKYIVENTIGKLCEEKKKTLGILNLEITDSLYTIRKRRYEGTGGKIKVSHTLNKVGKEFYRKFSEYRKWLLTIKVCDPACGSGAFLNQALNFLIKEHEEIDEYQAKIRRDDILLTDVVASILENNLYGVDINEESIEIAKLSLWLRTARRGRKLTSLSNNIKCGNSLIDDPYIAGDKAFDWKKEFPKVFKNGGFDVVIGNPPYGAKLPKIEIHHLVKKMNKSGLSKRLNDTYIAFYIESINNLLKDMGCLGFIAPNTWRLIDSGSEFRKFILSANLELYSIVQHSEKVFIDATVDVDSVFIKKTDIRLKNSLTEVQIGDIRESTFCHWIDQNELSVQNFLNLYLTREIYLLKSKIEKSSVFVNDCFIIRNGVKPYEKGKGKPAQTSLTMKEKPFTSENRVDDTFSPLIGGSSFHRYQIFWDNDYWIKYGKWLAAPRDKDIFDAKEKLIFRQTGDSLIGTIVDNRFIMRDNTHIILPKNNDFNLKFSLGILNSKVSNFIYWTNNPEKGEALAQVKLFHLGLLCIPQVEQTIQEKVAIKVDEIISKNEELNRILKQLIKLLQSKFTLANPSKKLQNWDELDFGGFIKELKKKKVKLTLSQEAEWLQYFNDQKINAQALKSDILQTDREIDQMVYELYGLTDEEIAIVENSIK